MATVSTNAETIQSMRAMKTDEAAAFLAMSPRSLWQLTKDGKIRHVREGKYLRFRMEDLVEFLQQRVRGGEPASEGASQ
jgi:excisionase family DNA binding protein